MATTYEIAYRLPVTKVRFTAVRTHGHDSVFETNPNELTSAAAEMIVAADSRTEFKATIETDWLFNVNTSLTLTDDQRLTSASGGSEGQLGVVTGGVLGALVFAAGVAVGVPEWGALIGAATTRATSSDKREIVPSKKPEPPSDPVEAQYKSKKPEEYEQLVKYRELHATLEKEALRNAIDAVEKPAERPRLLAEARALERLQSRVDARLDRLKQLFQTWRATTLTTWTEDLTEDIAFDLLPSSANGAFDPAKLEDPLKQVWERFGLMVVALPGFPAPPDEGKGPARNGTMGGIYERSPRQVTWKLWKKRGPNDPADMCIRTGTSLVCDAISPVGSLEFRKSMWAKRTMKATFGNSGSMSGIEVGSTSSLAGAAATIGALPGATTSALEEASKFGDQLATLRTKSLYQEADRAKKLLELKQTEVSSAGLAATEGDQAELLRLKQQVEIAESTAKLRPDALAVSELKMQTELVNARRDLEVARRQLQTEIDLAELRAEVDRLQAEWVKEHPGK